jgi:DNA polymerase-3 subunit epsilon/ATP-dependent DNA helicase DinG
MAERSYVALDLETTGLDANREAIIEIAAVRFQGEHILDRLVTLVNPQRPVPLRVQQLTGIRPADLAAAPTLAQITPELLAFVDSSVTALVAHNASFDLGFLRAAGLHFHRPALDTFELATILLPGVASYNLGELCRTLAIPLADAHRAADDAEATARLFMHLQRRMAVLPAGVLELIVTSAEATEWVLRDLFAAALTNRASRVEPLPAPSPPTHGPLAAPSPPVMAGHDQATVNPQSIDLAAVAHYFSAGGPLAQQMGAAYEARSGQTAMATAVAAAFNIGDHLLVEAGTGTGKTVAYLLPAALWSVANGQRVVIATNTLTLQDQLIHKDLPQVQALLAGSGVLSPRVAPLKGRANYLCTRRLHAWRTSHQLTAEEVSLLAKLLVWLTVTESGDSTELLLASNTERALWARLCSDPGVCTPERCGAVMSVDERGLPQGDFFLHARQRAESAHLLVVNHALLLADLATGGRLLPAYEHLIIDEAHHLEEVTTEQLTLRLEWRWLLTLVRRLLATDGLLTEITQWAGAQQLSRAQSLVYDLTTLATQAVPPLQEYASRLLAFVNTLEGQRTESNNGGRRIALDGRLRTQPGWSALEVEWARVSEPLQRLAEQLGTLVQVLVSAQWWQREPLAALLGDLQTLDQQFHTLLDQAETIIFAPQGKDGLVRWVELPESGENVVLAAAPLSVNSLLEQAFVHERRSTILTSATLRTHASFDFIQERLGLWDVPTMGVESPFDYAASTLLLLPSDLPAPTQSSYQAAVAAAIVAAGQAAGGRTLALFTSHAQLATTAAAIRAPLDQAQIALLQQRDGSRNRLLREYRQLERAVLLGARSFWEGVDLPGEELTCLIIVRLPFAVPTDPLVAARSAELDDPFRDYTLPEAVLRFRQGFGRLIRRASDRGVVIVLDSRLWQKEYGRAFLDALPPCTTRRLPLAAIGDEIRGWLAPRELWSSS